MSASFEPWQRAFLLQGRRTAALATVRADGSPHVKPVWFLLDGDDVVLNTGADTVAGRNLARDPRAALSVDEFEPAGAFVVVTGSAVLVEDLDQVREWATRIGGRYMGEDRAEEFGARNGVPGELLVRITPSRVTGAQGISD